MNALTKLKDAAPITLGTAMIVTALTTPSVDVRIVYCGTGLAALAMVCRAVVKVILKEQS